MCAQRRPAVKEAKESSPARQAQTAARQLRGGAPGSGKAAPEPKQSVIAARTERIRQVLRDTRAEMKKVTWPDKDTTRNLTIVVIAISVILGLLLGGIDALLIRVIEAI